MSVICDVCGKGSQNGHKVSHSNKKNPKIWKPNLQTIRVATDGGTKRIKVCTTCMRSGRVTKAPVKKANA